MSPSGVERPLGSRVQSETHTAESLCRCPADSDLRECPRSPLSVELLTFLHRVAVNNTGANICNRLGKFYQANGAIRSQ